MQWLMVVHAFTVLHSTGAEAELSGLHESLLVVCRSSQDDPAPLVNILYIYIYIYIYLFIYSNHLLFF